MRTTSAFQPNGVKNFELASTSLFSDANLVSYYKFEGNSNDNKGADNGTDTSIDYGNDYGKFGQGIRLNATTDKVAFTDWSLGTADWTISFWLNEQTAQTANTYFVSGTNGSNGWGFYVGSGATTKIRINHNNGATDNFFDSNSTLSIGTWTHITYTKSSDTVSLYVNGVFDKSQTGYSARNFGGSTYNNIGNGLNNAAAAFFDDLAVFTRALTATEVGYLYSLGTTKAYYPLNGNSRDYSGNTNTGTDTAITYPQGRFGQGAKFNGSTSKVALTGTTFPVSGDFTMSAWYNGTTPTGDGLVGYGSALATGQRRSILIVSGNAYFGGYSSDLDSNTKVVDGKWHNIIVTYTGTTCSIYVDGVRRNTGTLTLNTTNQIFRIGCRADDTSFINASADEIIIESRAWTAKEVETYYRKSTLNYRQKSFAQMVFTYTSELLKGSYTLTGKNLSTLQTYVGTLLKGAYTLTGKNLDVTRGYFTSLAAGVFSLVGKNLTVPNRWEERTKNSSTFTSQNKSSASTFTETNKSSSTWEETDKS